MQQFPSYNARAVRHDKEHSLGPACSATFEKSRSEEHTSELQSPCNLVCRLLLEKKKNPEACRSRHIHSNDDKVRHRLFVVPQHPHCSMMLVDEFIHGLSVCLHYTVSVEMSARFY